MAEKAPSARPVRLLLAAASALAAALLAVVVYFVISSAARLDPAKLSSEERERLLEGVLANSPGVHRWAYFEPRIGYTLRPSSTIEAWHDTFRSNEIGYRAPPLAKPPGTFRIVFVGDSWTYGMGVRRDESFPAVIERLANARAGADSSGRPRVEAWTLALPGYNLFNSLGALTGQDAPYAVVDPSFTLGEWENPAPDLHGSPAANELYGELGYELLATLLGWEHRPQDETRAAGKVFSALPPPSAWRDARDELRRWDNAKIGETFEPSAESRGAVAGRIDLASGAIPRASTLLVRRRREAETLSVELGRIAEPSLYPLGVEISLPSRAGGSRVRRVIAVDDPEIVSIALPIPPDIPPGDVIDVIIEADRAASSADPERSGRSLMVRRITQE